MSNWKLTVMSPTSMSPEQTSLVSRWVPGGLRSPVAFLMLLTFTNWFGFAAWQGLLNNFTIEQGGFQWSSMGLTQSVREIPGFLAFTAIFWILWMREQTLAYVSLGLLAFGIAITGFFPTLTGVLITTFIMSIGFHYFETVNQSLQLQLLSKKEAPAVMGKIQAVGAVGQVMAFGGLALAFWVGWRDYVSLYLVIGFLALVLTVFSVRWFPRVDGPVAQRKQIVLRSRYWLYYLMTFLSGARRQLFHAFAGFLLVKIFGYTLGQVALLMMFSALLTALLAPSLGTLVGRIGERRTIMIENAVLIAVFAGYATTTSAALAGVFFVLDGVFFTLTLAYRAYFQKIGDAADMAPTAAVAFTINHIAAVVLPVALGVVGQADYTLIFWIGVLIAVMSLLVAFLVPRDPKPGNETTLSDRETLSAGPAPQAA